jgi:hypothetical protein
VKSMWCLSVFEKFNYSVFPAFYLPALIDG